MSAEFDTGREIGWALRTRPFDLSANGGAGLEHDEWFATADVKELGLYQGWVEFDGTDDFVDLGDVLDRTGQFAIGLRFRTTSNTTQALVSKGLTVNGSSNQVGYLVGLTASNVTAQVSQGSGVRTNSTGSASYSDGEWHTLILRKTGNLEILFDGVVAASVATAVGDTSNANSLRFGIGLGDVNDFNGDIERVLIFDSPVSASTIASLLNETELWKVMPIANADGVFPMVRGHGAVENLVDGGTEGELDGASWSAISPPPGTVEGVVSKSFTMSASLLSGGRRLAQHALTTIADSTVDNADGELDYLLGYSWGRRFIEYRRGYLDEPVGSWDVVWTGVINDLTRADREQLTLSVRGLDQMFDVELQDRKYRPGYEPYVIFDGVDNQVDFGNNLNRTTSSFTAGVALRTTSTGSVGFVYGRKSTLGSATAGWAFNVSASGEIRVRVSDGTTQVEAVGPDISDGVRREVAHQIDFTNNEVRLYVDKVLVDTQDISALGSIGDAATVLTAGVRGHPSAANFFTGEIERVMQHPNGASTGLDEVLDALSERYADDVDASPFDHYVPLTENLGDDVGDLSPNGFHGTITGEADTDKYWSGRTKGYIDIEGNPVPIIVGRASVCELVLVDPEKLIYQASDGNVLDIWSVRAGGAPIPEDTTTVGSIWTNAPNPGEFRWEVVFGGDNPGAFVRLANSPGTAKVTASIDHIALSAASVSECFRQIANRHVSSLVANFLDLDIYGVGRYWKDKVKLSEALDQIAASAGAHWTINARAPYDLSGDIRTLLFQERDLTSESAVRTLYFDREFGGPSDFALRTFKVNGLAPVYRAATIRYNRYEGFLPEGQVFPVVTEEVGRQLSQEYRSVVYPETDEEIETVLAKFAGSEDFTFDTAIWPTADARTEAKRRFDVRNRQTMSVSGRLISDPYDLWLGDVVDVVSDSGRFGLGGSGKRFLVVGVRNKSLRYGTEIDLWGGFPV